MRRFLLLLMLPLPAMGALPEFKAVYDFERGRMKVGETVMQLERSQDTIYRYTSEAKATGFISVFIDDVIREESIFQYENGAFQPVSYEYRQTNSSKNRNESIAYDWTDKVASVNYRGHESRKKLEPGMLDRFLMQLAITRFAQQGEYDRTYTVLNNGRITLYQLRDDGFETLRTPAGEFRTLRIERIDKNPDKHLRLWLAPELDYLPVKIEQEKRNEEPLRLTLRSISRDIPGETPNAK